MIRPEQPLPYPGDDGFVGVARLDRVFGGPGRAFLRDQDDNSQAYVLGDDGVLSLDLPAGTYRLLVVLDSGRYIREMVTL